MRADGRDKQTAQDWADCAGCCRSVGRLVDSVSNKGTTHMFRRGDFRGGAQCRTVQGTYVAEKAVAFGPWPRWGAGCTATGSGVRCVRGIGCSRWQMRGRSAGP